MPLKIIREDITKINCDAIVNAANKTLLGGGGVDGAIHKAAGKKLLIKCATLGGCKTGDAKITKGYDLPCKFVIHTVGPVWGGGQNGEENLLRSCYRNSLLLAQKYSCESIAFPLISSGAYGYPKDQALKIALEEIQAFLNDNDILVYIVVYDKSAYMISQSLFDNVASYINDNYIEEHLTESRIFAEDNLMYPYADSSQESPYISMLSARPIRTPAAEYAGQRLSLNDALEQIDESFSEMLLRKIDEKGMTDADCYKRANVDRKHFSKIRSNNHYRPSKSTALAFAIALELSLEETRDLLMKAGFALSHSDKFDIIVEYFIMNGNYNIFEINETLFAFDQKLLGA